MNPLAAFGWTEEFEQQWRNSSNLSLWPARVIADFGTSLKVATPNLHSAELSGRLAHYSHRDDAPKVGDWVAVRITNNGHCTIENIIPRRSEIARKVAGNRTLKQVIAANIDIAFVLLALDNDFSVERLKRFLYQLSINHIRPVIVLNKADKTDDVQSYINQLTELNLAVITCIATTGAGVEEIRQLIEPGRTAILLGSSGVGKSTLTNQLLGRPTQKTGEVRIADSTGKHTTVHRELFTLPNGGMLIDTPGIRELQLWGTEEELDQNFDDITVIINHCKYNNCQHNGERKCAVRDALNRGILNIAHYQSYLKMKGELNNLNEKAAVQDQKKNKKSLKSLRRQARDSLADSQEEMS